LKKKSLLCENKYNFIFLYLKGRKGDVYYLVPTAPILSRKIDKNNKKKNDQNSKSPSIMGDKDIAI
jgi:hypothetical protein